MTRDNNKNITAITYNHLNLPTKITFGTTGNIVYLYNAAGQKVRKIVRETGKSDITTDYLGGYQYENNALKFFQTTEGYVEASGSSYKYVYQYKDHLGNIRLSYDKTLAIKEESNFYPFGLKQEGYNNVKIGFENKYKFSGKELQDENIAGIQLNWYDMEARNYMPDIGRWGNMDELAESFFEYSPYSFSNNNPIYFSDPSGLSPEGQNDIASTFIDPTGKVVEHRDDGDNNVYLVGEDWKKGGSKNDLSIVGKEKSGMMYYPGLKYQFDESGELVNANLVKRPKANGAATAIGGAFDIFGFYEVFFDKLFETTGAYDSESMAFAAFIITKGKSKPWINRKLYKSLSVNLQKKFVSALENGVVSPTGRQGIIKLTETEAKALNGAYTHKLKILGKGGDLRIYGNQLPNGQFVFNKILGH
jgi:RHS repeat-associated protein